MEDVEIKNIELTLSNPITSDDPTTTENENEKNL